MTYDLEKYRAKREKVLGVRRRGIGFGTLAVIVSAAIVLGLSGVLVPKSVAYLQNRNLEDAIYKLQSGRSWPTEMIASVQAMDGVRAAMADSHDTRLVVTFDRTVLDGHRLTAFFAGKGLPAIMLNQVDHGHRLAAQKKEGKNNAPF